MDITIFFKDFNEYGTQNNKNTTTLIYQLKNAYNGIEDINTTFNQTRL